MLDLKLIIRVSLITGSIFLQSAWAQDAAVPEGTPYVSARKSLIGQGWTPVTRNKAWRVEFNQNVEERLSQAGIREFFGCNGIGDNICYFYFRNSNGQLLRVGVLGGIRPNPNSKTVAVERVSFIQDFDL